MENEILAKATKLFLENGYKTVTMDDIASELNISKKTIYVYFSSKPQLIEKALQLINGQYLEQLIMANSKKSGAIAEILYANSSIKDTFEIDSSVAMYQLHKYYPKIALKQKSVYKKKFLKIIIDNLKRGIKEGVYRPDIDVDYIARFHLASHNAKHDQDFFPPKDFDVDYLREQHLEFYMRSICTNEGLKQFKELNNLID